MINKFGLTTIALSALLLSGCGGGGSDKSTTDILKEKDLITIIKELNEAGCTLIGNEIKKDTDLKDVVVYSTSSAVSCTTYGRIATDINDDDVVGNCVEVTLVELYEDDDNSISLEELSLLEDKSKACVIGLNL